jgi:hypothetical protein
MEKGKHGSENATGTEIGHDSAREVGASREKNRKPGTRASSRQVGMAAERGRADLRRSASSRGILESIRRRFAAREASQREFERIAGYQLRHEVEGVDALVRTAQDAATALREQSDTLSPKSAELVVSFLEHTSEHYGQMAVYSRLLGVVPPASRS